MCVEVGRREGRGGGGGSGGGADGVLMEDLCR